MTSGRRSDVELVISAKQDVDASIREIVSSFKDFADEGASFLDVFLKSEKVTSRLNAKQDELSNSLNKVSKAQKELGKVESDREKSLGSQEDRISNLKEKLTGLVDEYKGLSSALEGARKPNDTLIKSLEDQREKQKSLADQITSTRSALTQSRASFDANGGVDPKALENIEKQRSKTIELGKAWREVQEQVAKANLKLQETNSDTTNKTNDAAAAKQRLEQLREQVKLAAQVEKEKRREARESKGVTQEQVKARRQAINNTKKLREELNKQILVERELRTQSNASLRQQKQEQAEFKKLVALASKRKEAYVELKNALSDFEKEQQKSGSDRQAKNIESLTKKLDSLEKKYTATGDQIERTQSKLSQATGPDAKSIARLETLSNKIAEVERNIKQEAFVLQKMTDEFKQGGVSAAELTKQKERLRQASENLSREQEKLAKEIDKVGDAARIAGRNSKGFFKDILGGNGSRQSLSYLQRIRGELLSIGATYTGLYAVGDSIRSIFDSAVLTQKATARLSSRFNGDSKAIADEMKFIRLEADRLSFSFETLLDEYTRFVVNVPEGTLNIEQLRFVFSSFVETARVVGLSNDELKSTFTALSQIASKGSVQLEELKGQLAERIPKAIEATASGLSDLTDEFINVEELLDRINKGEVTSDTLVALAAALRSEFGPELQEALKSPQAALGEFQNVLFDLKKEVIASGFLDELVNGLREVNETMKTPEFKEGAKLFAAGLADVAKVIVYLIKNFETVGTLVASIFGVKIAASLFALGKGIFDIGKAINGSLSGFKSYQSALRSTLSILKKIVPVVSAALVGFSIGTYLNDEIPQVKKFGLSLVSVFETSIIKIKGLLLGLKENITFAFDVIRNGLQSGFTLGATNLSIDDKVVNEHREKLDKIKSDTDAAVEEVKSTITQMFIDIDNQNNSEDTPIVSPEKAKKDAVVYADTFSDELAKGLNFFRKGIDFNGVKEQFDKISEQLQEESADTLQERLALIEKEYIEFLEKLSSFETNTSEQIQLIDTKSAEQILSIQKSIEQGNIDEARANKEIATIRERSAKEILKIQKQQQQLSSARSTTNELLNLLKLAETQKVQSEQLKKAEDQISDIYSRRREQINEINELRELGLITPQEQTERLNKLTEQYIANVKEAASEFKKIGSEQSNESLIKFSASFEGFEEVEKRRQALEQIRLLEQQISDIIDTRDNRIQNITNLRQSGAITVAEAETRVKLVMEEQRLILEDLILKAIEFAQALGNDQLVSKFKTMQSSLSDFNDELISAEQINQTFASGLTGAIDSFIQGTKSAKDAFRQFIADFLRQISNAIIQALILKALTSSFGGSFNIGQSFGGFVNAQSNHTGGIIGKDKTFRRVNPLAFLGAFKYHNGGIAGLKPDEVPAILQRGEQVIPRDQVGKESSEGMSLKVINTIDSVSVLKEALNTRPGEQTVLNVIKANKTAIKQVLA